MIKNPKQRVRKEMLRKVEKRMLNLFILLRPLSLSHSLRKPLIKQREKSPWRLCKA
jgi:hypothetical protein